MIEFRNYSFTYSGAERPALSDISLTIAAGECVLLNGPSGCGKSTLAMTLNGIIPNLISGSSRGEILLAGERMEGRQTCDLAVRVGMVFQNPDNQLFAITVEEDVAFGPENMGLPPQEMHRRVEEALAATGMKPFRIRQIHRLSGGQKQRTAVAGLAAMQPDILVFDEPTADLDPEGTREVIDLIDRLHREQNKTILVIEHKLREILPVVDRVITLNEGRVTDDRPAFRVDPATLRPLLPCSREARKEPGAVQIGIHDVSYSYPDGTRALDRVNLAIHSAECVALIGQNGSGKTTLAKCIAGLMRPSAGSVVISSRNGSAGSARPPTIGYLFQNPDHQIVTDRVDREVAIGLFHLPASTREHRVRQALARVNLSHLALRDPCTLSRGERQRLAVASVLAPDPEIIIFDEPTTGQDPDNLDAILRELELFRNQGRTILMVTHDHGLAQAFADRIIRMEAGRISQDSILRSLGNIST